MNIAIFASAFHPHVGGVEELCGQLAREYQRRGMGVMVLTNRWPRHLPKFEMLDGIAVHRLAMRVPTNSLKSKISFALTGASVRRRMLKLLREFQTDVLHVQCVSCNAAYALMAKRELKLPLVVTLQGELTMDASQLFQREAWAQRAMRESLQEADVITACSRQTLEEAEAWCGRSFGTVGSVIYNGISPTDAVVIPYYHGKPYLLAIGRHVPQKGFDLLLRAMAVLVADPSFKHDLILAGDGDEHCELQALALAMKLETRVVFTGRVDHSKAMRLFAGCSLFVLPSRHEPFGIVNLEAMAAGKAIVATKVGGVPEIVEHAANGLLVPAEDVKQMTAAISLLAHDAALRDRLGAEGKHRAAEFSWEKIARDYHQVYRQTMKALHKTKFREKETAGGS